MKSPWLGDRVKEIVTDREGIVTGYCEYLWGCEQFLVYIEGEKDKDGDPKSAWFDVARLIVVKQSEVEAVEYEREAHPNKRSRHFSGPDRPAPIR